MFDKLPFFTCWSRKKEEEIIRSIKITKSNLIIEVPKEFNVTVEFHGYDTPLKCAGDETNLTYNEVWTDDISGYVL